MEIRFIQGRILRKNLISVIDPEENIIEHIYSRLNVIDVGIKSFISHKLIELVSGISISDSFIRNYKSVQEE